ncbi:MULTISPECIES: hypothetical protein [Tatumella]|uniref:Uncharacterized protein n=1 Tax=Tatumella punctata TaxID=399969 RepID=A0ABW1VQR4_9GAMM|nr:MULTISPECIES: hypothetical protein [unclassified Tatumella]
MSRVRQAVEKVSSAVGVKIICPFGRKIARPWVPRLSVAVINMYH